MGILSIYPISESAVTLQFGNEISPETHKLVMHYANSVPAANMPGFVECVPAYTTLTIHFDFMTLMQSSLMGITPYEKISSFIKSIKLANDIMTKLQRLVEIPVCYDEEFGLDLHELSKAKRISIRDIIRLHTERIYSVYMIGFTPGFPYLGEVDEKLFSSRKQNPRKKLHAGSVGIAGKQTGVYPHETPGGWQILGRTPLKLFAINQSPPALLQAGMRVKFVPITRQEFDCLLSV